MKCKNTHIEKTCCFYASDWHLTVMLLPYINNKVESNNSIYMKCENDIKEKMAELLNKLQIKNKNDILKISWNNQTNEDDQFSNKEKIYIVSGDEEYISSTNQNIEQYYNEKNTKVKIINCYKMIENCNVNSIINKNGYKKILNTKGEKNIE